MITLVKEYLREVGYDEDDKTHVQFRLLASLYISGHFCPTLGDVTKNEAVFLPKALLRISHRIVAIRGFYFSGKVRMDDITVQGDDEDWSFPKQNFISIWFAKPLAFLRVNLYLVSRGKSASRTKEKVKEAESVNDYCFIQYNEVLP